MQKKEQSLMELCFGIEKLKWNIFDLLEHHTQKQIKTNCMNTCHSKSESNKKQQITTLILLDLFLMFNKRKSIGFGLETNKGQFKAALLSIYRLSLFLRKCKIM